MDFAVSTVAFAGQPIEEIIDQVRPKPYRLEFSSGLPYRADMEQVYRNADIRRLPHNYFPAPAEPFVVNLASLNTGIRRKSIDLCTKGLELAKLSGAPFFAAHAGFCIDPDPNQLGKQLNQTEPFDRATNMDLFVKSLAEVLATAARLQVPFCIENNVVAAMNVRADGSNPLFCGAPVETVELMQAMNNRHLGLLLDTGHLKVSASTLGFDADEAVQMLRPHIMGLHHSDNDGQYDTNEPITPSYWFLKHMPYFAELLHVLEVKKQTHEAIDAQLALLQQHGEFL